MDAKVKSSEMDMDDEDDMDASTPPVSSSSSSARSAEELDDDDEMGPMVGSSVGKEGAGEEGGRESSEEPRKLAEAVQHSSSVKESFTVNVRRNEFGEVMDVNEYHIVRELGAGAFASVYLCTTTAASAAALSPSSSSSSSSSASSSGAVETFAVKHIEKSILKRKRTMTRNRESGKMTYTTAFDKVEEEVAIMKKLEHRNLVRLHEVMDDDEDDSMFMVLEYVDGGCVLDWDEDSRTFYGKLGDAPAGLFTEARTVAVCLDILNGLEYLHLHHIAHRDLKPENVLLKIVPPSSSSSSSSSPPQIVAKIADFGVAHYFEDEEQKEFRSPKLLARSDSRGQLSKTEGTYYFWAPEMCDRAGASFSGESRNQVTHPGKKERKKEKRKKKENHSFSDGIQLLCSSPPPFLFL